MTFHTAMGTGRDASTDAHLTQVWAGADDFRDLQARVVSFASRLGEHGVVTRVTRRLDGHTRSRVGWTYFNHDEGFAGGNYNDGVHIISFHVESDD